MRCSSKTLSLPYLEWDNESRFFRFSFHATYFIFFPNECPGLCLFIHFSKRKSSYISGSHFIMRSKYYFLFGWSHLFPKDPLGQVFFTEDSFIQPWSIERKKSIRWVSQLFVYLFFFFCLQFFVCSFKTTRTGVQYRYQTGCQGF